MLSDVDQFTREELIVKDIILGARKVQEFLWGEMNSQAGLEEYKRMLRKRMAKIEEIKIDNPHWQVELKKRLLQISAISVQVLYKLNKNILADGVHPYLSSNLEEYKQ